MKNNKGLSTVVTTLIIILLVLVAVGIIWGVVNNLLKKGEGEVSSSTKCLGLELRATKVNQTALGNYDITLTRTASGGDEDIYAKFILYSASNNSDVEEFGVGLAPLATKTASFSSLVENATSIQVTAYYVDENGNDQLCSASTTTFEF